MKIEDALATVLELAEQNALMECEVVGDAALQTERQDQLAAFEIVQDYIDTDCNATMPRYTRAEQNRALVIVCSLARDNILDDDDCNGEESLISESERQLEACVTVEGHSVNHGGKQ